MGERSEQPSGGWAAVAVDVRAELLRGWQAYTRLAWGHDELHPVSGTFGEFFDPDHPVGLTIVEALDTLYVMGLDDELAAGVTWITDHLDFRGIRRNVQVFETNIRMVGGLLSGYLATGAPALLEQARTIADILLPAFVESPTGAPYRFVNPSTGELSGVQNSVAEIGTFIAEFGTLSRILGDDRYYQAAKRAARLVYDRRSALDLVGTTLNIESGTWIDRTATIHPPVDSFLEYLWDGWDLFRDEDFRTWYDVLTAAVLAHQAVWCRPGNSEPAAEHLWFVGVDQDTGSLISAAQSELGCFYAGLLGQSGQMELGAAYLDSWTAQLARYPILPEELDPLAGVATSRGNALRPEYVDAALNLWLVTGAERFRDLAYGYYLRQRAAARAANGWTVALDVTSDPVARGDLTPGYWWSEQMKYWYLMFADVDRVAYADLYLSTEGNILRGLRRR
jgi:mannosyl-oligosaccharide alpha-1,2-mannosidase